MKKVDAEKLLRRVRLELARDHDFPNGSSERGYDLIAPLDAKGHIALAAWKELKDGSVRIEQTIYVMRDSQKKIVLGAKGATIKEISMAARQEIGEMVGAPVHLFLFVKVREHWGEDPARYREMGLDYPKE